jgi:hypothetical protein
MAKQPKYLSDAGVALQTLLDTSHPCFNGSEYVREALNDERLRLYVQSWILPTVEALASGNWPEWVKKDNARRAIRARLRVEESKAKFVLTNL